MSAANRRIAIYSRKGCGLCDEMIADLEFSAHSELREFDVIDIDDDPQLLEKYNTEVPLLIIDGREVCRHQLDESAALAALALRQ